VTPCTFSVVREDELDEDLRAAISALFPRKWARSPARRARAWTQQPPTLRVVGRRDGAVVAHAGLCVIRPQAPRVVGISDLAVAPERRRQGIGTDLMRLADGALAEAGAEVSLLGSSKPTVRRVFLSLGYRPCGPGELFFRRGRPDLPEREVARALPRAVEGRGDRRRRVATNWH
jgi:predicted N-acetyltransferase YhbS